MGWGKKRSRNNRRVPPNTRSWEKNGGGNLTRGPQAGVKKTLRITPNQPYTGNETGKKSEKKGDP